jgi:hypothetical protein
MANTNCLEGMACPKCGSEGPFKIECKTYFEVYDSGTGDHEDVVWDEDSLIECMECHHDGTVFDFRMGEDDE